jgi:16S rRNA (guanine966-N2)-methyltransferase
VREALFSMLGQDLSGQSVLDPFGGTGALSFEAWSRGAASVVCCEGSRGAVAAIRKNARALGVESGFTLVAGRVPKALPRARRFDLVLVDPPYADDPQLLVEWLEPCVGGVLVLEHSARQAPPTWVELTLSRTKRYGDTHLSVFERSS